MPEIIELTVGKLQTGMNEGLLVIDLMFFPFHCLLLQPDSVGTPRRASVTKNHAGAGTVPPEPWVRCFPCHEMGHSPSWAWSMDHPLTCPPPPSASPIGPPEFYSFDLLTSKWQSHPGQHGQSIPGFNFVFPDWVSGHCPLLTKINTLTLCFKVRSSTAPWPTPQGPRSAAGSSASALNCPSLSIPPTLPHLLRAGCWLTTCPSCCTAASPGRPGKTL